MDVWRFLTGGELLLSTGLELARSTPAARVSYVQKLARAGTRALALELVQWLTEVPADMLEAARAENLALIAFRTEVSYRELTQAAHREILVPARPRAPESTLQTVVNALVDTRRDRAFIRTELGALLALPPRPRMTLLATLEVLLEVHFNITAAARKLGIRRQTVYYRLEQLTGLLGSLDDPSRKLGFLVALALLRQQAQRNEEANATAHAATR
jgi:purine catabolism regulator